MSKSIRKLVTGIVAAVMALFVAVPAFAANTSNNGSITLSNATIGKKYQAYKILDATYDGTNIAYTTKTPNVFNVQGSPFSVASTPDSDGDYTVTSTADAETISSWIKDNLNNFTAINPSSGADSDAVATVTTVSWSDLHYGYYYVTSEVGTTATITSVAKEAPIIDKNQKPGWGDEGKAIVNSDVKKGENATDPDKSTANYGDTVNYEIKVNATQYDGEDAIEKYYINDKLDAGLTYNKNSVVVKVGTTTLTGGTDYTLTWDDDSNSFKITINWYDSDTKAFASYAAANATIDVTYNATVNTNAVIAGEGNKNTASFDYETTTDEGEGSHKSSEETTTTYTYALGLHKIDGSTKTALKGAKFSIKGITAKATSTKGVYEYSADDDAVSEFEVGDDGELVIKGVKAGTYTVTETKAPEGYDKLANTFDVTASVDSTSSYTTTTTTYYDANGKVVSTEATNGKTVTTTYPVNVSGLEVENYSGGSLPSTGGMGTTIFTVVGATLVVAAGALLVTRKRMEK